MVICIIHISRPYLHLPIEWRCFGKGLVAGDSQQNVTQVRSGLLSETAFKVRLSTAPKG
jgi:hypothetical protein